MRRHVFAILTTIAALLTFWPAHAQTLPTGWDVVSGEATITTPASDHLTVNQISDRSVIQWDTFNIGVGAKVDFVQPTDQAATLNIVDGSTSSILAGQLTATGSVFLINPHGITITPDGSIDTGGAFVASTLSMVDTHDFMNGSDSFAFEANGGISGSILSAGTITARDVLLLAGRVENSGTITVPLGRVALGSASHATLDLSGDGFLQVLAPATVDGEDALVTNSGTISADGGLVQLKASTVYEAMREAVNMPGTVRARSVSGQDGAIVFGGGDGGAIAVSGTVDAGPDEDQSGGGSIQIVGRVVDVDFSKVNLGAGGHFSLAADVIEVVEHGEDTSPGTTRIIEGWTDSSIGNLLRAGVDVTLHSNKNLTWTSGLMIAQNELTPEAQGQAGNMHLLAGELLELGGAFSTHNGEWMLTANAKPAFGVRSEDGAASINLFAAEFINDNGQLTLEILGGDGSAGYRAWGIDLPSRYSGDALAARIAPGVDGYDWADITIRGDINVAGDIRLSGHLRTIRQHGGDGGEGGVVTTLSGRSVTWMTEESDRLAGGLLRFVEDGVVTRFGRGGVGSTDPEVDAARLILGSSSAFYRLYGEADPSQIDLGDLILTVAPYSRLVPGERAKDRHQTEMEGIPEEGIPLSEILAPGSISVTGPGVRAETNAAGGTQYYLVLGATDQLAFKPLETWIDSDYIPHYVGGAAGGLWIDLSGLNAPQNRVPLVIEPRPLSAHILNPSYTYGSPTPLVALDGLVNDDEILPVGLLDGSSVTYQGTSDGFGIQVRTNVGEYAYSVTGITGERAGNYALDVSDLPIGTVRITPRALNYDVHSAVHTYGSALLPSVTLTGLVDGDVLSADIALSNDQGAVAFSPRLSVGSYEATVTGIGGRDAGNYVLATDGNRDGSLQVQPKALTWRVEDVTSVYGTLASLGMATLSGVLTGDDVVGNVTIALKGGVPLAFNTNAGTYANAISVVALEGTDSGNYIIANAGNRTGTLTIHPKQLSLSSDPISFVYGDTSGGRQLGTLPLPQLSGVVGDDDVSVRVDYFRRRSVGDSPGGGGIDWGVGEYEVSIITEWEVWDPLEGDDKGNYILPQFGHSPTRITITPRPLHFKVDDITSTYGTRATPTGTLDGIVGSDDVYFGDLEVRDGNRLFELEIRTPVGEYEVTLKGLSGHAASNYTLATTGNTPGILRINPKLLQIAPTATAVYGDELRFDATFQDGIVPGDTVQLIIAAKLADGTLSVRPGAGTHAGVVTGITGEDAANYVLPPPDQRLEGVLNIAKRPLTVQVLDWTRTYGDFAHGVASVDNLVPGDALPTSITFAVSTTPNGSFTPLTERTGVGTYWVRVAGLDDPNYTLAATGHTDGQVRITPRPIRYTTFNYEMEYGQISTYLGQAELNAQDILPGDQVYAEGVVVQDRSLYPEVLPANNKYRLVPGSLGGMHRENYVLEHAGSTQGLLTVTPKVIDAQIALQYNDQPLTNPYWTFGDLELTHGFGDPIDGGFTTRVTLTGVLSGDEVSLSVLGPTLEYSHQGYLAAGDYEWKIGSLTGVDSGNYVLADDTWTRWVEISPRRVQLEVGADDLMYGESLARLDYRFLGDDNRFFQDNSALDVTNLVLRSGNGFERTLDELWNELPIRLSAGHYYIEVEDEGAPFLVGADAKNFEAIVGGSVYVEPRPLYFVPPEVDSWTYGDRFSPRMLYETLVGPEGMFGVLEGDQISLEYWSVGRGISEHNKDHALNPDSLYNNVGEYSGFGFRLQGPHAGNYELVQPQYTVTIKPRPLDLPFDEFVFDDGPLGNFVITYGDEVRPVGNILPMDAGDLVVTGPTPDGTHRPVSKLDAGRYKLSTLGLQGQWAFNYVLEPSNPDFFLKVDQRQLFYSIDDVEGQYGNFLPCLDPVTCNGGRYGIHGDNHLWVPGLTLGQIQLEGVLPGDEVRGANIILIDANGRTGTLEDMPPPGIYFQVADTLIGEDAHNYRISETGSVPGILFITPQWVRWETHDGLFMPETGLVTLHPEQGLISGIEPTLKSGTTHHQLEAGLQFTRFDSWGDTEVVDPNKLVPGNYYVDVAGFTGPVGSFYQPVPPEQSERRGVLSVFADSTLGLDLVAPWTPDDPDDGDRKSVV